ncbi:hypothetical protein HMPREF9710_02958 [Massilia timonae CCUG 45783]|uniref:Carboxymuconolactone decarboxylase-like domain-containing protein n=3 Tax=Massilia timonae TaxID=47229 RepID=K9DEQ4_9BURK|nr:hypothetical protein HMPREF9710_02958 [Massilia timonae CCUG 45783]
MLGVSEEDLAQLSENIDSLDPPKTRAIIRFGLKCARDPQSLTSEDFSNLRGLGLTESEIMELISMSALAVYANIVADATKVENDEMFSQL